MFQFNHNLAEVLQKIRTDMPGFIGFEETCLMVKPLEGDAFVAMNPNSSKESLKCMDSAPDLFYFHPYSGISIDSFNQDKLQHYNSPRSYDKFNEAVDCLCPTILVKDVIYVPLKTSQGKTIGVVQLVNKIYGCITEADLTLAANMAPILANGIDLLMKTSKLSGTVDFVVASVQDTMRDYEPPANYR